MNWIFFFFKNVLFRTTETKKRDPNKKKTKQKKNYQLLNIQEKQ